MSVFCAACDGAPLALKTVAVRESHSVRLKRQGGHKDSYSPRSRLRDALYCCGTGGALRVNQPVHLAGKKAMMDQ